MYESDRSAMSNVSNPTDSMFADLSDSTHPRMDVSRFKLTLNQKGPYTAGYKGWGWDHGKSLESGLLGR